MRCGPSRLRAGRWTHHPRIRKGPVRIGSPCPGGPWRRMPARPHARICRPPPWTGPVRPPMPKRSRSRCQPPMAGPAGVRGTAWRSSRRRRSPADGRSPRQQHPSRVPKHPSDPPRPPRRRRSPQTPGHSSDRGRPPGRRPSPGGRGRRRFWPDWPLRWPSLWIGPIGGRPNLRSRHPPRGLRPGRRRGPRRRHRGPRNRPPSPPRYRRKALRRRRPLSRGSSTRPHEPAIRPVVRPRSNGERTRRRDPAIQPESPTAACGRPRSQPALPTERTEPTVRVAAAAWRVSWAPRLPHPIRPDG